MVELEECIKDAIDTSMKSYTESDVVKEQKALINQKIQELRSILNSEEIKKLNKLLDLITTQHGLFSSEAYLRGTIEGIALRSKVEVSQ